jgi:HAT1-interacting factor 1
MLIPADDDDVPVPSSSKFVFGGDEATFDDDAEGAEDEPENAEAGPSSAAADGAERDEGEGEAEEGADEPEDDYNAAWEVLDVARTIYAKAVEGKSGEDAREDKLNLAETYLALGDVSLETGAFRL